MAARRFTGGRLVIATHNPGKLVEISELLSPFGVAVIGAAAFRKLVATCFAAA